MQSKSFLGLFDLQTPKSPVFNGLLEPFEGYCDLPHTQIISNLGYKYQTFRLQFTYFLAEDPSIAVFSIVQEAAVPSTWRSKPSGMCYRASNMYRLAALLSIPRPACKVAVVVGSRRQYKASAKALWYWNAHTGVLLADWNQLYDNYFAQKRKGREQATTKAIVEKNCELDKIAVKQALRKRLERLKLAQQIEKLEC